MIFVLYREKCLNTFSEYDDVVDEHSVNRGKQRFEKMIAGMYLGEIVRLILLDLCKQGVVFGEEALDVLETKGKNSKEWPFIYQ